MSIEELFAQTSIDPWFLVQIKELVDLENGLKDRLLNSMSVDEMRNLKRKGFSDRRLAKLLHETEKTVRAARHKLNVRPVYKRVDTCAAEFATNTAYMYSTYEEECESNPTDRKKIMVLGGGPTVSGKGSNSTTAASTRRWRCAMMALKPSWSTATLKPFPPTTTLPTVCISSH